MHHKLSGREPSRWSRSREHELGPSAGTKRAEPRSVALLKEKYTTPQWAGISAAIGLRSGRPSRSTEGSCFSDYWLKQQKILPQHLPLLFK